jgi:hypothetical protein
VRFAAYRPPMAVGQSIYIRGFGGPIPMRHDRTVNYKIAIYWWSDDLHLVRPPRKEAEITGSVPLQTHPVTHAGRAPPSKYSVQLAAQVSGVWAFLGVWPWCNRANFLWAWRVRIRIVLGLWVSMVAARRDFSCLSCACRSFGCHASPGLRRTLYENRPLGACQT